MKNESQGIFTSIEEIEFISYDSLLTEKGRDLLQFIDDEAYYRLPSFFDLTFYNGQIKGTRFNRTYCIWLQSK